MAATSSESGGSSSTSDTRVRSVRLVRRPGPTKLGFSVRGGKEHRTGFFITAVEPSSEAHLNGLQVGDQIIRVNGYPVDDATHKELLQLIQGHNSIILKVRSVGMIPIKEDGSDELTWKIVEHELLQNGLYKDVLPDLRIPIDVPLVLKVPPKTKLGCGICKGPEWKPGIFVQFTKENSIARDGGLKPGDQIIKCNSVVFSPEMPFSQAVSIMRASGLLDLVVRKGAGLDLFPGESSGYNSSASSVAGDNPSSPWTHKVNGSPLAQSPTQNGIHENLNGNDKKNEPKEYLNKKTAAEYTNGSTIIQVNGDHLDNKNKVAEICMVSQQTETKTTTVLVEVHHSEEDTVSHAQSDISTDRLTNSSVSSFTSSASSLSSAISQELERRSKRPPPPAPSLKGSNPPTEKLIKSSGLTKEEVHQHERLMQEFKKAHQKMFSSSDVKPMEREEEPAVNGICEKEKKEKINEVEQNEKPRNKKPPAPPPPPPMPEGKPIKKQAPKPPLQLVSKAQAGGAHEPPCCPTPDYDTLSVASLDNGIRSPDAVDMQSLESFRLTNPTVSKPLPPHTYFSKPHTDSLHSAASTLILRETKPLVTVREYPGDKRNPSRLDFLPNHQNGCVNSTDGGQPVQTRLHSELEQTLSRSNLRPDALIANNMNNNHENGTTKGSIIKISVQPTKVEQQGKQAPFYLFPNERRGMLNAKEIHKNSVSFNFVNKDRDMRNGSHPNGILKNGANNISHVQIQSGVPHKSIKFGAITTVIRDTPEPKA